MHITTLIDGKIERGEMLCQKNCFEKKLEEKNRNLYSTNRSGERVIPSFTLEPNQ